MKNLSAKKLAFLGVFTAIITLATAYLFIPNGIGYTNLGDGFIMLSAMLFGPYFALIAGGLGSCLANIILGYTAYAPFTLIVKGLEGLICGLIVNKLIKTKLNAHFSIIISMLIATLIMVLGYFLTNCILYSVEGGISSIPNDFIQAGIGIVVGYLLTYALSKIKGLKGTINNILWEKENEKN